MKKIILLTTTLLLLFGLSAKAQDNGRIVGVLTDKATKESVPMATVRVLHKKDSTFVSGRATNDQGKFSIPVAKGAYIVHISFIGYNDEYRNVDITSSNPSADLGKIELSTDNILLSEAVVTAKAPEIVVKGDTVEYNADSYKVTESAVIEDLLKKMPGVEIDSQGKITVNGKEIKKILVDGEEFFSDDPKVASKNLPAKMVDKLQILERKTDMAQMTGFDDGEEENVINLTVKKGMKEGLFGNAFAGYGSKDRYEANAMANYMRDKDQYTLIGGINNTNNAGFSDLASAMFGGGRGGRGRGFGGNNGISTSGNIGGNFSKQFSPTLKLGGNIRYGYTDTEVKSDVFTQNILSSGNTLEDEDNRSNNKSQNFNMSFRMEWEPDTLTKIIFRPDASIYENKRSETGRFSTRREETNDTINNGNSEYYSEGNGKNLGASLDVSRTIGKPGRVLSAQVRGNMGKSDNDGTSLSSTFYKGSRPDDIIDQRFSNNSNNHSWRVYASYVEPIGKSNFLQIAYQYRNNYSESDKDTRSQDENGNYTVLDSTYSKRLENNFIRQELELNYRSMRENYDYMVGFSVQPSSSKSKTFIGEKNIDDLKQNVVNYAPMAQFNYRWSRTHNLRIRYFGSTSQPSVTQLSPVVDISDPLNISFGNPNLKPSFEHRMNIRYRKSNAENASSINAFLNGGFMTNSIVRLTATNAETGRKINTFENISGNWNANGRVMFNVPLKNIKFSIFSMTFAGYSHNNGYTGTFTSNDDIVTRDEITPEKNLSKQLNMAEVLGLNYRSDLFDFSIRGNVNYNKVRNTLDERRNQEFLNYGGNARTTIYLPWDLTLESDINYATNSGYADGFKQNEWLWNASLQKTMFKQKNGTLRFKIYDILQQRSNINRSVTSNYIRDTTTNTLTSYFMVHFVYRFNIFKGGATAGDMMPQRGHRMR
ncbi:MAG: outer membrane beta-barrel protein [Fermentimonas sp.]|jgi:hypothetical protein